MAGPRRAGPPRAAGRAAPAAGGSVPGGRAWWGWPQDVLAGYRYAPGRALLLLAGASVGGVDGWSSALTTRSPWIRARTPAFNAALYTLDVLIPAPAFGQGQRLGSARAGPKIAVAAGLHILG